MHEKTNHGIHLMTVNRLNTLFIIVKIKQELYYYVVIMSYLNTVKRI
jgi:hypothetical protein